MLDPDGQFLQSDAALIGGDSGGPLFLLDGRLIAIVPEELAVAVPTKPRPAVLGDRADALGRVPKSVEVWEVETVEVIDGERGAAVGALDREAPFVEGAIEARVAEALRTEAVLLHRPTFTGAVHEDGQARRQGEV